MKTNIRKNVFETNSSSSHSLVVATKKQKEDFEQGLLWFNVTYDWREGHRLKDPKTGKDLPAFVDQETADRVYEANRKAEKKDAFLTEELINVRYVIGEDWFCGNAYESMEAEKREDGKYNLHINHFFG